ncbi:hypothetical protein M9H77_11105 [Catharanthus roseus]|uniref:Uncharacterized protein n=1 Tax=Catharanthus roseus TaxID=4058 RepID=A0ACC0BDL2_CATRO|nr:hypothetical protein M9H77_11105 [Catharanthus roseus]
MAAYSDMPKLGGSLKVASVQELAKTNLSSLPPRYVRPEQHPPFITSISSNSSLEKNKIPVIDLQKLLSPLDDDDHHHLIMDSELHNLDFACREWGFFQLINHGVSSSLVEKLKQEIEEFFNLPIEEKMRYEQEEGDLQGYGQAFVLSEEQKLDWGDMFYLAFSPTYMRKPHLLPKLPPPLRESLEEYSSELKKLGMKILNQMAKALGMKVEEMKVLFEEGIQGMRMNYYPPCPQPELAIGLCPHSDAIGLTILLQFNDVEGLQVRKHGIWVPVSPLPNAFVINVGDILEIITNGVYKSVEHRATVNKDKKRLSLATFLSPKLEGDFGPALSLIGSENPPKFKRIGVQDYFRGFYTRKLDGKSYLDSMRI